MTLSSGFPEKGFTYSVQIKFGYSMSVSVATKDRINYLSDQIRWNRASLTEYREYVNILIHAGVSLDEINAILSNSGFHSVEEFAKAKQLATTLEQKQRINDALITGALIGIGIALILGISTNKK